MTRVLITGAGGFAGSHYLEHVLKTTDWNVVATDSFRHRGKTDRISEVLTSSPFHTYSTRQYLPFGSDWGARTEILTHDLTVPFSNQAIERIGEIDYMACYASESHVDRSISDPVSFSRNNVDVALTTLELARTLKPKALVWVSTDEVYGPVGRYDYMGKAEWSAILPSNPYSASKAAQEAFVISYWRTFGVPAVIVNAMNMIGERQDTEKVVPMVIGKVMRGEEVTIHGMPGNIGTRHYLHARNLADGINFILGELPPRKFGEFVHRPDRYNIASPERTDNLNLAQMIAEDVGKPLRYRLEDFHTTRPGHDPHYGLDSSKLRGLGWNMPVPFRESLRKTVEWTLRNPEWLIPD